MTVSEHLADYILSTEFDILSPTVTARAKTHFVDTLSCMFLGTKSASVQTMLKLVKESASGGTCVFPDTTPVYTDEFSCAMLCAMSAHSNDFDDMSTSLNGHPSALLVPVIFAMAQKYHTDGKGMLRAYIAGVETDAILGKAFKEMGYNKGINATNFIGIFGAVASAGLIAGLNKEQLTNALGIAVDEASGFKANFGTLSKDLAIGMTAVKAIAAIRCAQRGINSNTTAFEGEFGFFKNICGLVDADRLHELICTHVSDFITPGLVMKPYPSCRGNHCGIDCITKLVEEYGFSAEDVAKVICRTDQAAFDTDRYTSPKTPEEAKFSLAYCIAKVLYSGHIEIKDFIGNEITDKAPLSFIKKVEIVCAPELFENSRFGTEVEVTLTNKTVYSERERYAKGDPCLPMTRAEIDDKLRTCLSYIVSGEKLNDTVDLLARFETLGSAREIIGFLY